MITLKTTLENLLSFVETEALHSFLLEYAATHSEFEAALQQKFAPVKNTTNPATDYCKKIEECFHSSVGRSSYHRYSDFQEVDLDAISSNLNVYLEKAAFLLEQNSFGDVASIALQILRLIGENYDVDQYYAAYDDWFPLESDCAAAATLLLNLSQNAEVPQSLKELILNELRDIAKFEAYSNYDVYDIEKLLDSVHHSCLTPEESIKLIDRLISEENESYRMYHLVKQKIDLLRKLNRDQEAEATIEKYIFRPEIREIKIAQLLNVELYKEALQCLDEGICVAQEGENLSTVRNWMENKLTIYQQTNQVPDIIATAKELFFSQRGSMEYYHLLKKHIACETWKPFLESLINQTKLANSSHLCSNVEADIYVAEKDEKQLITLLRSTPTDRKLEFLLSYGCHLKKHSAELIDLYTQLIKRYAQQYLGRNHYEYVTRVLKQMKELEGGEHAVDALVAFFRATYKMRRAMMEILNKNFG